MRLRNELDKLKASQIEVVPTEGILQPISVALEFKEDLAPSSGKYTPTCCSSSFVKHQFFIIIIKYNTIFNRHIL